jgi:hypothetical protein
MNEFRDSVPNINTNSDRGAEPNLTPEQRLKTDRDIRTLHVLNEHAARKGVGYSISGGYAGEAHCGGVITRPHGDMDVEFMSPAGFDLQLQASTLAEIIDREQHTKWRYYKTEVNDNYGVIKFREDDATKKFLERRRLEAYFITAVPTLATQEMKLIDSEGNTYEVNVQHIADLVATKIRILNERTKLSNEEKQQHKRQTSELDKNELKRLISQNHFKKEECIEQLRRTFYGRSKGTLSWDEALFRAEQEWQEAMTLLAT